MKKEGEENVIQLLGIYPTALRGRDGRNERRAAGMAAALTLNPSGS